MEERLRKKSERWKIIICRGRVEDGREFEKEEWKLADYYNI
jgi:hypothetical protein